MSPVFGIFGFSVSSLPASLFRLPKEYVNKEGSQLGNKHTQDNLHKLQDNCMKKRNKVLSFVQLNHNFQRTTKEQVWERNSIFSSAK